jgi:hypothetical protein
LVLPRWGGPPFSPAAGIWAIPADARDAGFSPATAPRVLVDSPAWMTPDLTPAELDYPPAIAGRWARAADYAQQGIEVRARAAAAAAVLPFVTRAGEARRLEDRAAALTAWAGLYSADAPAVLASLAPFAALLHAIGESADSTRPPNRPYGRSAHVPQ